MPRMLSAILLVAASIAGGETNTWLGKSADWADGANWSMKAPPSAERAEDVLIPVTEGGASPVLSRMAVVGGALRIERGATLDLQGHDLGVGLAVPDGSDSPGLIIEAGAALSSEAGTPTIMLHAGGLGNEGSVRGRINLRLVGQVGGFVIDGGRALTLAELSSSASPFPYQILAKGSITVEGSLVLAGGRLVVQTESFVVKGDLVFKGREPKVMLVPENDLLLHGTIKSEGSAFCVEAPGSTPKWNPAEERAVCELSPEAGWVRLVGEGDQAITPGGILPPIAIDKPSGAVTVAGNLHCNGLLVAQGNTLDLSKGPKLILGHGLREAAKNPERGALPRYGPCWTSRGLVSYGTIKGTPAVPISFLLNVKGTGYVVDASYLGPVSDTEAKAERPGVRPDMSGVLFADFPEKAPGSLSVNRSGGRIQLRDGKLLLDGEPYKDRGQDEPEGADELELDDVADEMTGDVPVPPTEKPRARVTSLRLTKLPHPKFHAPPAFPHNLAPNVEQIVIPPRGPIIWAVNGHEWDDVYDLVDGDRASGFGGASHFDFVFPQPVTVSAVRLVSSAPVNSASQFIVRADTTGDGWPDKVLCSGRGGVQPSEEGWLRWGESWVEFPVASVRRLRLQAVSSEGKPVTALLNEFAIYGDRRSHERLREQDWVKAAPKFPNDARFLAPGEEVQVVWPQPAPENVVHKTASTALWMFGVGGDNWKGWPHLREHSQAVKVLDEIRNRYRFDVVTVFYEGAKAFHWPSVNFRSETNAKYLAERKAALAMREAFKERKEKTEDEFGEVTADEPGDEPEDEGMEVVPDAKAPDESQEFSEELKVGDLPCQRNLLKELCELAHERDLKVFVICRPEDVSSRGAYIGPPGKDTYELFLQECAAAGVDGFSLTPDEESLLWTASRSADWGDFHEAWKERRKSPTPEEEKRYVIERGKLTGNILRKRMDAVRKTNPKAEFWTSGARLGPGGDPFDIIGHVAEPDYIGCHYQAHIVRRWAAMTRGRRVKMGEYAHRSVRWPIQSMLQGARLISTYRFNYIALHGSEDHRIRENIFIDQFVKWGGTRPTRPPIAFLVSRASERWWPMDCKKGLTGSDQEHRAGAVSEAMYGFLMRNGYSFDVYYLDQVDDLAALKDYHLVVLPFAYSIPRAAVASLDQAYEAGANFLVCDRKGEVDEVGRKIGQPLLQKLIDRGSGDGRVRFLDEDLVALEARRNFTPRMASVVDELLGEHKDLHLKRYGNKIEGFVFATKTDEQYVSLINWGNREAQIEAGLNLPDGEYRMLTLSSDAPSAYREGIIDGAKELTGDTLRNFAVKLNAGEVLALYVVPTARAWGKWE